VDRGNQAGFAPAGHAAVDLAAAYLRTLPGRAVWRPVDAADRERLADAALPAQGRPLAELLATVERTVLPYPMGNGHPRFFGWVNPPPDPAGIVAELLAATVNPSVAGGDHSAVHLERCAVRWLAELVGYPHRPGGGLLTSGASAATVVALAAARHRAAERDGWDVRADGLAGHPPFLLYVGAEGHSCLRKAAELLGIGDRHVRQVPVDADGRMDVAALRALLDRDAAGPGRPFCVAASAGTVSTGAVDPLAELADLCAGRDLWLHVDGAYGAFGVLDEEIASRYAGMDRADSLVLDPHKWLSVPVGSGCLLVRDGARLRAAFSLVPAYLRDEAADELGWFAEYGTEQTRPFRALKTWAVLAHRGRSGVAGHVRRCNGLARQLAGLVEASADLELATPVVTSIVAFRYRPGTGADPDAVNRGIPRVVQERGRAFLTGAVLDGHEAVRACILHPDTTGADLSTLVAEVRAAGAALAGDGR
jgi:aromatic-L-amino-acid/L-tryptophan decarboxylase